MIDHLRGQLSHRHGGCIVLDVGGLGLEITLTLAAQNTLPDVGQGLELCTHLAVREDALQLFGFADAEERTLFRHLIAISGVGPKLALNILSGVGHKELMAVVEGGDPARLAQIPGIGKKTAGRLLLELSGKLPQPDDGDSLARDAMAALGQLGIGPGRARTMVQKVRAKHDDLQSLVRAALRGGQ